MSIPPYLVLILDDLPEDRELYRRYLSRDKEYTYNIRQAESAQEAFILLREETPDLILLDYRLPDIDGLEFLKQLSAQRFQIPVIMLTGQGNEKIAVQVMKSGAQDYLIKGQLTVDSLCRSVHAVLEQTRLQRHIQIQEQQQQLLAAITIGIRQFIHLEDILPAVVQEVREFLKADRVLIYQFDAKINGLIVAESVLPHWSAILDYQIEDTYFRENQGAAYRNGKIRAISDIYNAGLTACHIELLEEFQIKANLIVPILINNNVPEEKGSEQILWGLLIAQQCSSTRQWQTHEITLLEQLSVKVAVAIQQAELYQNLQTLNASLEQKIQERTVALENTQARLLEVQQVAQLGSWELDVLTNKLTWSGEMFQIFRLDPNQPEPNYEEIIQYFPPAVGELQRQTVNRAILFGESYALDCEIIRADGSYGYIFAKGQPIQNAEGEVTRLVGIAIDISDRKQAEAKLQQAESKYRNLIEQIPGVVYTSPLTITDEYAYISPQIETLLGISEEEWCVGFFNNWINSIHPEDRDRVVNQFWSDLEDGRPFQAEYRIIHRDGRIIWVRDVASPVLADDNRTKILQGIALDITPEKEAEIILQFQAQLLKQIHDAVISTDLDGIIQTWNHGAEKLYGYTASEMIGQNVCILYEDATERQSMMLPTVLSKGYHETELILRSKSGDPVYVSLRISVVKDHQNNIISLVGCSHDISQQKKAEESLNQLNQELEQRVEERTAALQQSEARLQEAQEIARLGSWECDAFTHEVTWSNEMFEIFGLDFNQPEPTYEKILQHFPPGVRENYRQTVNRAILFGESYAQDIEIIRADGSSGYIFIKGQPILNAESQVIRLIGIAMDISERKFTEKALRDSEERFRQLAENMHQVFYLLDLENYKILYISPSYEKIWGRSCQSLYDQPISYLEAIHPEDEKILLNSFNLKQIDQATENEYRIVNPDGTIRWILDRSFPIKDESGKVYRACGIAEDISERKQAVLNLEREVIRRQIIFNNSVDGIHILDIQGNLLESNINFASMLGYTPEEMVNFNVADWDAKFTPEELQQCTEEINLSTSILETLHRRKNGSVFEVEVSACGMDLDGEFARICISRDISERKWAERTMQHLIAETVSVTGDDFFTALVKYVSEALDVRYALVSKLVEEQLDVLAFCANGESQPTYSYNFAFTPCEITLREGRFYCDSSVQQMFPQFMDLIEIPADSYLGIGLKDNQGNIIGNLCILDVKPFKEIEKIEPILRIFAARASVELERQAVLDKLNELNYSLETRVEERTQKLQERETQLYDLFDNATDLIQSVNPQGQILFVNSAWKKTLGYTDEDLIRLSILEIIHPDSLPDCQKVMQKLFEGSSSTSVELKFIGKDGREIIVEGNVNCRFENDQPIATRGIFRDITDRKRAEKVIHQQIERESVFQQISQRIRQSLDLSTIFDTAVREIRQFIKTDRVAIFKFYPDSNLNDGEFVAESIFETFDSVLEIKIHDHCFSEKYSSHYQQGRIHAVVDIYDAGLKDCHRNVLAQFQIRANLVVPLLNGENLWGLLCIHQCSGPRHWQEFEINLVKQIASQLAIAIQQTNLFQKLQKELAERHQAETRLKEINQELGVSNEELARATRLKDEFLANMSHELRTPLNAILGMTEGLLDQVFGIINEQQQQALQTIDRSGTHLLELINDILDLAKIESGNIELNCHPSAINQLCLSSITFIKQLALQKRIQIEVSIQPNLPVILLDERRIRQVLINLLNNAVKFTLEGGYITLKVTRERCLPEESQFLGDFIRIMVIDTGIGIAAQNINKLFQPFIQIDSALNRQYAGTGLGLSLVKRIIEMHGGRVNVSSEVGVGSCFSFDLPCGNFSQISPTSADQTPDHLTTMIDEMPQRSPLILLAEDNEANISTISSYLKAKGYHIILAKNGREAIEITKREVPDLIVMDIQMAEVDGLEAIKLIRRERQFSEIPIIALTALAMAGDRERCLAAGANEYLTKPVKLRQLTTTIQELLNIETIKNC